MTGRFEADQPISQPTDCPETGMLVWLAGVKLEIDNSQAYYDAAQELGIFSSNVTQARIAALGQQLTATHTPTMQDRLTPEGRKHFKQTYPKETRKLVAKMMLSHVANLAC